MNELLFNEQMMVEYHKPMYIIVRDDDQLSKDHGVYTDINKLRVAMEKTIIEYVEDFVSDMENNSKGIYVDTDTAKIQSALEIVLSQINHSFSSGNFIDTVFTVFNGIHFKCRYHGSTYDIKVNTTFRIVQLELKG